MGVQTESTPGTHLEHTWNIQYKASWAVNLGVCKLRASLEFVRPVHESPVLSDFPRVKPSQALPHCLGQLVPPHLLFSHDLARDASFAVTGQGVTSQTLEPVDHCHSSSQAQPPPHFFPPLPRGGGNRLDVLLC